MSVHTYQTTRRRIPDNSRLHRLRTHLTCHQYFICYVESALVFIVVYIAALLEYGWYVSGYEQAYECGTWVE